MTRSWRNRLRIATTLLLSFSLGGCGLLFDWGNDRERKREYQTTGLVQFLYGDGTVPMSDAQVELELPIRVGLSFLPGSSPRSGDIPTAADREQLLNAVRAKFKALPYVTEIVIIPDYYLTSRDGDGFDQVQLLAGMFDLDLVALASYNQVVHAGENSRSLAYLTIVGAFVVRGETQAAQTIVDLAVVEPRSRQLVMRAGGTAKIQDTSTLVDDWRSEIAVRRKSFNEAGATLIGNFQLALTDYEQRVREGTAPVRVTRRASGGTGALDLASLVVTLGFVGLAWRSRRRHALRPAGVRASP